MRINVFSPFAPIRSGIVTYSEDLAAALEKRNVQVNRVNPRFWSVQRLGLPGIYRSARARHFDRALTVLASPFYAKPADSNGDIHHFHLSGANFCYTVVKHFHKLRGPRVVTVHEQNFATANPRNLYDEIEQLRILRASDLVLVHTQELKDRLGFINSAIEVVPHGVYQNRFEMDSETAKQRLGLNGPVVAQLGFQFHYKGVQNFLKAATRIKATILLVGSGPYELEVRRFVNFFCPDRAVVLPYLDEALYRCAVAASDVMVFPRVHSQGECSGVMVQAMAAGKGIVAHDIGCYREYLAPDRGILTQPENIVELRDSIERLLNDSELRQRCGQACREFARRELEWDRVAERHLDLFRRFV
jgi:glycosyltransferase involved in cell wall biosynthesis